MIKRLVLFCCLCLPALAVSAQEQEVKFAFDNYHRYYREARLCTDSAKLEAMKKLRVYFHEHPYRLSKVNMSVPPARCLELLTPEGTFSIWTLWKLSSNVAMPIGRAFIQQPMTGWAFSSETPLTACAALPMHTAAVR